MLPLPQLAMSDIQDLYSMAFVQAIIATAGFNFSKPEKDRESDDLNIELPDSDDFQLTYNRIVIQVKCSYRNQFINNGAIHFPLPVKNYDDLRSGINPKILVVVMVPDPDVYPVIPWVESQIDHTIFRYKAYWKSIYGFPTTNNVATVTVSIPMENIFNAETVHSLVDRMAVQGNKIL